VSRKVLTGRCAPSAPLRQNFRKGRFLNYRAIKIEDETEIRAAESGGGRHDQRHSANNAATSTGGGEDPHRAGGLAAKSALRSCAGPPPPGTAGDSMRYPHPKRPRSSAWSRIFTAGTPDAVEARHPACDLLPVVRSLSRRRPEALGDRPSRPHWVWNRIAARSFCRAGRSIDPPEKPPSS
jgi:hypothetical protein